MASVTVRRVNAARDVAGQAVGTNQDKAVPITLGTSDAEGDVRTCSILCGPSNGTLSGTAPGLTYTRNPDFNGSDRFTLKMNGGKTDSGSATVFVTLAAVSESEPPSGLTASGAKNKIQLRWNASLAEGDQFNIYRSTTPEDLDTQIAAATRKIEYQHMGVSDGETYHYVVTAEQQSESELQPGVSPDCRVNPACESRPNRSPVLIVTTTESLQVLFKPSHLA